VFSQSNYTEIEQFLTGFTPKKYKQKLEQKLLEIFNKKYAFIYVNSQRPLKERLHIGFSTPINYDELE
jgi:hypothetical protein